MLLHAEVLNHERNNPKELQVKVQLKRNGTENPGCVCWSCSHARQQTFTRDPEQLSSSLECFISIQKNGGAEQACGHSLQTYPPVGPPHLSRIQKEASSVLWINSLLMEPERFTTFILNTQRLGPCNQHLVTRVTSRCHKES